MDFYPRVSCKKRKNSSKISRKNVQNGFCLHSTSCQKSAFFSFVCRLMFVTGHQSFNELKTFFLSLSVSKMVEDHPRWQSLTMKFQPSSKPSWSFWIFLLLAYKVSALHCHRKHDHSSDILLRKDNRYFNTFF